MSEEIDFVVTWVDGEDEVWQDTKKKYSAHSDYGDRPERYRNWGWMRYWFRGVEKYAPWVRKIHFVTWGHLPGWLETDHPKLHIVQHEDFLPQELLPVFNSSLIERYLHRIPGLAEKFVLFNDDMFLNQPVEEEDFFQNGLPCYEALEAVIRASDVNEIYSHIMLNNISVINARFSKRNVVRKNFFKWFNLRYGPEVFRNICLAPWNTFQNITNSHLPVPFLKSTFYDVWKSEPEILDATCSHQFRSITDVNQYLFRYWDIMRGKFVPKKRDGKAYHIGTGHDDYRAVTEAIRLAKGKMICINDTPSIADFEKTVSEIHKAFESRYPDKSMFEK